MELLTTLSVGTPPLEGWFRRPLVHIAGFFWAGPLLALPLVLLVYVGRSPIHLPESGPKPQVSFVGFLFASLGLSLDLRACLEQGERLDWLHSGTISGHARSPAASCCWLRPCARLVGFRTR